MTTERVCPGLGCVLFFCVTRRKATEASRLENLEIFRPPFCVCFFCIFYSSCLVLMRRRK